MLDDDELMQEAKTEILELVEATCELFISIENDNCRFTQSSYDALFRLIHSIKGSLGMIGLENEAHYVHLNEDLFREFSVTSSYSLDKISMMIDFYHALDEVLRGEQGIKKLETILNHKQEKIEETKQATVVPIRNYLYSIPTLRYQHLEEQEIIILGNDVEITNILNNYAISFDHFDHVELIYKKRHRLKNVKMIILSDRHPNMSEEAIIQIINNLYPHIFIILIQENKENLIKDASSINYMQLGRNSKYFRITLEVEFQKIKTLKKKAA